MCRVAFNHGVGRGLGVALSLPFVITATAYQGILLIDYMPLVDDDGVSAVTTGGRGVCHGLCARCTERLAAMGERERINLYALSLVETRYYRQMQYIDAVPCTAGARL